MSKIQKAIRDIEKRKRDGSVGASAPPVGQVISDHVGASSSTTGEDSHVSEHSRAVESMEAPASTSHARRIEIEMGALRNAGFLAPEEEERVIVDQYRQIKRPLIAHALGRRATKLKDGRLILITSAMSGDGKTFTCINLALSIARERDLSVLLVDADVAKSHVSRLFGAESELGLLDLLQEGSELSVNDVILGTNIEGLSVLTAGENNPHATELLSSNRMESLIKILLEQDPNRIIIFDSPPLLATSESRVLATLAGQVVLVVHAGQTPQHAVSSAIDMVDESKALNLVLNQARHAGGGEYYGTYGYGFEESA